MDVTSIALSGLNAAERRLANSANNIVNANTPGYTPTDLAQTAQNNGGVRTDTVQRQPQTPEGDEPRVSLEQEVVNAQMATYDFQANLQVMKKQREMEQSLLDIQA